MIWSFGLRRYIRRGRLTVIDAHGGRHVFGTDATPSASIRLHESALHYKLLINPDLYLGEAYMDGTLTIEEGGTLPNLLNVFGINQDIGTPPLWEILEKIFGRILLRFQQFNFRRKSKENVSHHYDLSETLYRLFLDEDMQYSCAYFKDETTPLAEAQRRKKAHIAAKLLLKPGMHVLDVGCGWGGMALYLAQNEGVSVTGITLSEEQHRVATQRAADAGLSDRVKFYLRDYREETGRYDRIVSVGMFEHVGAQFYGQFFGKLKSLLKPDGIGVLHSIGRMDGPAVTNSWLRKYIFPGAGAPALSEVLPVTERKKLWVTDVEILRLHYAYTLAAWQERFQAARAEISALYDERFCRMWEFYLASAELYFRYCGVMVFQIQFSNAIDAVPITRDYMGAREMALLNASPLEATPFPAAAAA